MSDSPVSFEDIRAAAETYQELGPEYRDAVVASFLDKIDREIAARVEARLAGTAAAPPAQRKRRLAPMLTKRRVRDLAAAGAGALAVVGVVAAVGVQHASSVGRSAQARVFGNAPGGVAGRIRIGPDGKKYIVIPQPKIPPPPAAPKAPPAPQG
jgi:hypothetical protein